MDPEILVFIQEKYTELKLSMVRVLSQCMTLVSRLNMHTMWATALTWAKNPCSRRCGYAIIEKLGCEGC